MTAYLLEHPPARQQYIAPRREEVSGVVAVHTAENTPDFVAFDGGAEATARYISTRTTPGSYHDLVDSDSILDVVPYGYEAFHDGTGTNRHSLGLSIATRADVWPLAPAAWRAGAIENAAQAAARMFRYVLATTGIRIPPRRVTADLARLRVPGFVSHAELDPTRRTDPGAAFPWPAFLDRYAELTAQTDPTEEDPLATYTEAQLTDIVKAGARAALNEATAEGQPSGAATIKATLARTQVNFNLLNEVRAIVRQLADNAGVDIDEAALAAALVPALLEGLEALGIGATVEAAVTSALEAAGAATHVDVAAVATAASTQAVADFVARLANPDG